MVLPRSNGLNYKLTDMDYLGSRMGYKEVNLKQGMPTVDAARKQLVNDLVLARQQQMTALKIIHGYGSSGEGGAIKAAIRKYLLVRKREGRIRSIVPGEEWNLFGPDSRKLLEQCPDLSGDTDLNRANPGVTLVLL
jgi:hypothetical protein